MFAVALAVGLTPELLPMVTTVTLARGAVRMAGRKVIVKKLSAIHDLGAMDVLCTDKTGTLTEARIELSGHFGLDGKNSDHVLDLAAVNSRHESGSAIRWTKRFWRGRGSGQAVAEAGRPAL
jgi:Mg2+-importing ATPase